jgi:hypothetical protein
MRSTIRQFVREWSAEVFFFNFILKWEKKKEKKYAETLTEREKQREKCAMHPSWRSSRNTFQAL